MARRVLAAPQLGHVVIVVLASTEQQRRVRVSRHASNHAVERHDVPVGAWTGLHAQRVHAGSHEHHLEVRVLGGGAREERELEIVPVAKRREHVAEVQLRKGAAVALQRIEVSTEFVVGLPPRRCRVVSVLRGGIPVGRAHQQRCDLVLQEVANASALLHLHRPATPALRERPLEPVDDPSDPALVCNTLHARGDDLNADARGASLLLLRLRVGSPKRVLPRFSNPAEGHNPGPPPPRPSLPARGRCRSRKASPSCCTGTIA